MIFTVDSQFKNVIIKLHFVNKQYNYIYNWWTANCLQFKPKAEFLYFVEKPEMHC